MTIKKIISSYQPKKRKNQHKSAVARKWAAALLFSTYFFYFQTISAKEFKKIQEDIFIVMRIVLFLFQQGRDVLYKKARSPPSNLKFQQKISDWRNLL